MSGRDLTAPDPAVTMENHGAGTGAFWQAVEVARVGRARYVLSGGGRRQDR